LSDGSDSIASCVEQDVQRFGGIDEQGGLVVGVASSTDMGAFCWFITWLPRNNACLYEKGNLMITTTTHTIEGRQITAYLDIVSAESVQGVNVIRDMFAGMRDFFGGRSQTLERALKDARTQATDEIKERARALQADAVVGLDYEISMPAGKGGMVVVFVTGTAVKLR
jgi:uncharacterized protein YbjQ (UPF0145 family)